MDEFSPIFTSPMTEALGATKTISSITGDLPNRLIIVWCLNTARKKPKNFHQCNPLSQVSLGYKNLLSTEIVNCRTKPRSCQPSHSEWANKSWIHYFCHSCLKKNSKSLEILSFFLQKTINRNFKKSRKNTSSTWCHHSFHWTCYCVLRTSLLNTLSSTY
jgi:hypothetical protein